MGRAIDQVVDAVDVETFILCRSEEEAKELAEALAGDLNLRLGDIVFLEFNGMGARLRLRSYVHRPGDRYRWLEKPETTNG